MLADLLQAAVGDRRECGWVGKEAPIAPDGHGDVVAAECFVHVWHHKSDLRHFRLDMLLKPWTPR
jgi:hypothetical protein